MGTIDISLLQFARRLEAAGRRLDAATLEEIYTVGLGQGESPEERELYEPRLKRTLEYIIATTKMPLGLSMLKSTRMTTAGDLPDEPNDVVVGAYDTELETRWNKRGINLEQILGARMLFEEKTSDGLLTFREYKDFLGAFPASAHHLPDFARGHQGSVRAGDDWKYRRDKTFGQEDWKSLVMPENILPEFRLRFRGPIKAKLEQTVRGREIGGSQATEEAAVIRGRLGGYRDELGEYFYLGLAQLFTDREALSDFSEGAQLEGLRILQRYVDEGVEKGFYPPDRDLPPDVSYGYIRHRISNFLVHQRDTPDTVRDAARKLLDKIDSCHFQADL